MSAHPERSSLETILRLLQGAQVSAVVSAAIELDVFSAVLAAGSSAELLAERIGCPVRSTRMLLDALAALGLVERDGAAFRLSAAAATHLVRGLPTYVGDAANILCSPVRWAGMQELSSAIRGGGSILDEPAETPEHPFWETFARSSAYMAVPAALALARLVEPLLRDKSAVRVLDVGAGSGIYGFTLARDPRVELTWLDWPNVLASARQWAAKLDVDERRVRYVEGDLFQVDYGGPYDIIVVSHVYHHFDAAVCRALTQKIASALAVGGRVVVHEFIREDPPSLPLALFAMTMLAWSRQGQTYAASDFSGWFAEAGLCLVETRPAEPLPTRFLVGERAG